MREFAAVIFGFILIPVISRRKLSIGFAICIAGVVVALFAGMSFADVFNIGVSVFTDTTRLQKLLVVAEIGILGSLLQKYGIMSKMIKALRELIKNPKIIMMIIPALVGLLVVPGGAVISAPFIQDIGRENGVDDTHCAIINLIFRHVAMHITPYFTSFLLIATIAPNLSTYKLIGLNLIFVVVYLLSGYLFYVKGIKISVQETSINSEKKPSSEKSGCHRVGHVLLYASPIYTAILLNIIFNVPFYIAMAGNLAVVFLMHPRAEFFIDAVKAFNFKILLSLIGVYFIQGVISNLPTLITVFTGILSNPKTILLGIILASFFFGMATGFQPTSIGVILPILISIPMTEARFLLYTHTVFCWGFLGYFFSPLHLCQLFTCEYMGVSTKSLYREYVRLMIVLPLFLLAEHLFLSFIF